MCTNNSREKSFSTLHGRTRREKQIYRMSHEDLHFAI